MEYCYLFFIEHFRAAERLLSFCIILSKWFSQCNVDSDEVPLHVKSLVTYGKADAISSNAQHFMITSFLLFDENLGSFYGDHCIILNLILRRRTVW